MDAHDDDLDDTSPAADDGLASGGGDLESDESSDRPPSIVIPTTSRKQRRNSAHQEDVESSCSSSSSSSSLPTSATAASSRCPRSAGEMRSDREIITMVCTSTKSPEDVDTLDLSAVSKKTRKALKSLRALADFVHLVHLNVADNAIASVDGVDAFAQLEVLSLARNQLKRIGTPLFSLRSLRRLDLSGNVIAHIPQGFAALEHLEVLNLAGNSLGVLNEVEPLSKLANLYECSFAANPFCKLPTYKAFVICKLPSLEKLDDAVVTESVREKSRRRFSDEHFSKDARLREAGIAHAHEQNKLREARSALEAENVRLKGELHVKSKLLQNKSKEWSAATGQLLQLQQELAMLNLDRRVSLSLGGNGALDYRSSGAGTPGRYPTTDVRTPSLPARRLEPPPRLAASFAEATQSHLGLALDSRDDDDGSDFRLNSSFGSASPSHPRAFTTNVTASPTRPNLRYAASPPEDATPVLDVRATSPTKPALAKRLVDSACSPLRKSVSWSPEKPTGRTEPKAQQDPRLHRLAVDAHVLTPQPIAESPLPGRSQSFERVRRAFSDVAQHTTARSTESVEQEGLDLAEDDAIKHDMSMSRSIRLPTFEDDLACPAYEDSKDAYRLQQVPPPTRSPRQLFSEAPTRALKSLNHLERTTEPPSESRSPRSPSPPRLLAAMSPRSPAQRVWERQHAEFREQTFGSSSPRKSPLRFSQDPTAVYASSVSSPAGRDILARQIQALQSCKQSLVSEIAKEEQLLHALKQEASSYAGHADQLHMDIQVCLSDSAGSRGGGSVLAGTGSTSANKQRDEENYRAKLEFCRSKLRFAEDKEKEIEMAMVRTTKRVLQSDVQNAPFDKEIFALTHKLQQVIVNKEEVHQEMSRLMALVHERQGVAPQAGPSRPWQQQTVDEMLEMEEQQQRLSAERQEAVAVTRKRLEELQRRYNDVADRVRVKEDLIASLVDELKDVEKELELIGQRIPAADSPFWRRHQPTARLDASFATATHTMMASPEPLPSQKTIDAVDLELAQVLKQVKDVQLSAVAAVASVVGDESSSSTADRPVLTSDSTCEASSTFNTTSPQRQDGDYKPSLLPAGSTSPSRGEPETLRGAYELRLKELLTAEVLEEIKKDIYERLSRQLAAATSSDRQSVSQDHAELHNAIATALETQMKLALERFHKTRESGSGARETTQQQPNEPRADKPAPVRSVSPPRRVAAGPQPSRAETPYQATKAKIDAPRDDDVMCDQLDDFTPLDTYTVKYRFVKHRSSAPPSPSGGAGFKPSARAAGAQRILKACERLEQVECESKVDPISAIELDRTGHKRSSLKVLLMGARDLPMTHLRTKNLDPYVSLEVVYPEHIVPVPSPTAASYQQLPSFRSRTKKKSVYPVWDEEFTFAPVLSLKGYLHVRVLNDRRLSREQLVGEVRIPLRTLLHQKKTVEWFPLRLAVPSSSPASSRTTGAVLRASGGAIRLQLQLAYSRVEKYKRAIDELVTKYVHEHNHLPPFVEAAATQNQDEHELFENAAFASSHRSRVAVALESVEALDELRRHQYRHLPLSTAPEMDDSPRHEPESILPTFEVWKAERESEALAQSQSQSQHQRLRDGPDSSSCSEPSPARTSADVKIASRAFDSGSLAVAATYSVESTTASTQQLSAERSRQLWETPVAREPPRLAEHSSARAPAPVQATLYPMHSTYTSAPTVHSLRDRGRCDAFSTPSSNHRQVRPTTPTAGLKAPIPIPSFSSGRPEALSWAGASSVVHHRRPSKSGSVHAQSFNPIARRRSATGPSHHHHHRTQSQQQRLRPDCFDDYSPYHPDFQYSDPLDLTNGRNSDLFASRTMKRQAADVFAWQANFRSSSGGTGASRTDLRIFKSPGFARRQPSAGFPERYIGLDNQTSERLKRMFGRIDTAPS